MPDFPLLNSDKKKRVAGGGEADRGVDQNFKWSV